MKNDLYREVWDLDLLFHGGSDSDELNEHFKDIESNVWELKRSADVDFLQYNLEAVKVTNLLDYISTIKNGLSQVNTFVTCLLAQNPQDSKAKIWQSKIGSLSAIFESSYNKIQKNIVNRGNELLDSNELSNYRFILSEWCNQAELQLSEKEENIISELMVDGYDAWGQLYQSVISDLKVQVPINGEVKELSVGQAINLRSHTDENLRKLSHNALEDICKEKEEFFAKILNHIAGFRLEVYKFKGIQNILHEPLINNRMKEETLQAMWKVIHKHKHIFVKYLDRKAEILGDTKLYAHNFWAPSIKNTKKFNYKEAVDFIVEHFSEFGSELDNFTINAFENGWVESENRQNKLPHAFCAGFPESGDSRIFMTFNDGISSVLTLAHELGHAFHNYAMQSVEGLNKQYPMSVAETASFFSEMIVLEAAIKKATSAEEKLFLLDEKIKRSVMNFMNIHSRFLFEKKFYEERKNSFVPASRLNELMEEAIDEAYSGSLRNVSAHSWVWTPHFYITKAPFYNFPYTFGYLFSVSIYAKAKKKGKDFEKAYLSILRDSGRMTTENLVMKHLGEDITLEDFWEKGIELCMEDVEQFLELSKEVNLEKR